MKLDKFLSLPEWLKSNVFFRTDLVNDSSGKEEFNKVHEEVHPLDANLISSQKINGKHILFLDIDQRHFVNESTTKGHSHIYIDADLSTESLKEIIDVLAKHGIVQQGIKKQLDSYGFLTLRPPGVKKGVEFDDADITKAKLLQGTKMPLPNKDVKDKFKSLKDLFKSGKTSKEIQDEFNKIQYPDHYGVAVTGEIVDDFMKDIFVNLGLKPYDIIMSKPAVGLQYLTYSGKKFCTHSFAIEQDIHKFVFFKKDFQIGQFPGVTWNKVVETLKSLGG